MRAETGIQSGTLFINGERLALPGYKVLNQIGEGANAKVFLVHNIILDRHEALKIWFPRKGADKVNREQYYAELRKNALFTYEPSIATIYFGDIRNDYCFCIMEYYNGIPLRDFITQSPNYFQRWALALSICNTLKQIYEKGVFHGDLHDRNIIVNFQNDDFCRIIDLGTSILSGRSPSQKRDAKLLFKLSLEVLPQLEEISFYNDKSISDLPSPEINSAFRSMCWLLMPKLPEGRDPLDPFPPEEQKPPDLSCLNFEMQVNSLLEIPVFSLEKIDQFMKDHAYTAKSINDFHDQLLKKLKGSDAKNQGSLEEIYSLYYKKQVKYLQDKKEKWEEYL